MEETATTCGCLQSPRRVCDLCAGGNVFFVACSARCLRQHLHQVHGNGVSDDAMTRTQLALGELNARFPHDWDRYTNHRRHVADLIPLGDGQRDICVFGAGNCSDIDLDELSQTFREIHLVDLDGTALQRARERQAASLKRKIVLHEDVDLSGFLGRIEEWGERFPEPAELNGSAVAAARSIVARVGRPFDVTVSCCVLSQLVTPFHRALAMPQSNWANLVAVLRAVHLATLAGSTVKDGTGVLTFDVLSSATVPQLATVSAQDARSLSSFLATHLDADRGMLDPDPEALLAQFRGGLGALVASPRLTAPWLWDINGAVQLVYGLVFERI